MKEETLKDWIKKWSIKKIVDAVYSEGMSFQANMEMKNEDAKRYKDIVIGELKRKLEQKN